MADSKSSSADTIVKIVLVFFISLLSFSIGTFVGKKFSDNEHRLSKMEPQNSTHTEDTTAHEESSPAHEASASNENSHKQDGEHSTPETTAANDAKEINDEDVEALANEFVDEDKTPDTHQADKSGHDNKLESSEEPQTTASAKTAKPAHQEVDRKMASTEGLTGSTVNEIAQSEGAKFTIQIASYPSEEEAQKKADDLKKQKFEAFYTPATIKGQVWYRVNVGKFATAKEAQNQKQDLIEKTHINTAIIQKLIK